LWWTPKQAAMLRTGTPACIKSRQNRMVALISWIDVGGSSPLGDSMLIPFSSIQLIFLRHPTLPVFLQ